ncbi:MAG: homoserine O-acetyltransferase [Woeseia sp.]
MHKLRPVIDELPEYLARHVSPATQFFKVPSPVSLDSGRQLEGVTVAYRTWGDPANAEQRAILVCHALTGSADVDAWWPGLIGEGRVFDPRRDYIVCSNILGSCYGTTGPVSVRPDNGARYRAEFPRVTVRDMVRVQRKLLDHLGVKRLAVITGPSLGGMQALEWAVMYPERVASIVPIGVGGRHSAWCIAMSEAQRAAIYADPDWSDGNYSDERRPGKGLAAARMMAVCSYRSWQSFDRRFGRQQRDDGEFEMHSYLRYQAEKINERFDANSYVRLTQAMNDYDLAHERGDYPDVLQSIRQRALVVSISSDQLYPPQEQRFLADQLPNASYAILDSAEGHDGFLIESAKLGDLISAFRFGENHRQSSAVRALQPLLSAVAE